MVELRDRIECNFVLSLFKQTELIPEYSFLKNGEDIITKDGQFYYGLANNLWNAGYRIFDEASIDEYLSDKDTIRKGYEERGGYQSISDICSILSIKNFQKSYDDLCKDNLIRELIKKGFPVDNYRDKFAEMSSTDIVDFLEYQLNELAIHKTSQLEEIDLNEGYDEAIDNWDKGAEVGLRVGSAMINYSTMGIHMGHLEIILAGIGIGKTSISIPLFILPTIKAGHDVVIMANEQGVDEFRMMILSTVVFNELGHKVTGLDRHMIQKGGYTPEQREYLNEGKDWLHNQKGHIYFYELQDYNITDVRKIINRRSKLGCPLFIFDTFKPLNETNDRAWAEFSEMAKELSMLAKRNSVGVIATAQLTSEARERAYLNLTCVGKSRAIAETADIVLMFRRLTQKEKEGGVKPFSFENGAKKTVVLDPNKPYIMMFLAKDRYGDTSRQIIIRYDQNFNSINDVGWWVQSEDFGYGSDKRGKQK